MLSVGMIESLQSVGGGSVVVGLTAMIEKLLSKFDLNTKKSKFRLNTKPHHPKPSQSQSNREAATSSSSDHRRYYHSQRGIAASGDRAHPRIFNIISRMIEYLSTTLHGTIRSSQQI